jgi:hypothetical protein
MSVTQMQEVPDEGQSLLEERQVKPSSNGRRNPPARNTSRFWFERFLAVIQRQNPSVIDSSFLSQIAPSNEGKLLAQLKFLHVIDEQGKATPLLPLVNMVGDEQRKGFQQIVSESYKELFAELKLDKALPDDLINYFIRKYSFTRDKAINASKFFLYLADKGSVSVSQELSSFLQEKSVVSGSGPAVQAQQSPKALERFARTTARDVRAVAPQRRPRVSRDASTQPVIQAMINIRLDKDTPKEYWDRVFTLLGERADLDVRIAVNSDDQGQSGQPEAEKEENEIT